MAIKHSFVSAKADDADTTLVRPSNWNDNHVIDDDTIAYAKIQNISSTDKLLGRATAGAGDIEEIDCTAAGRALIDDVSASAQRTTLGLGTMATEALTDHSPGRPASRVFYWFEDFVGTMFSTFLTAGSGLNAVNQITVGHPGIVRQAVTATATPDRAHIGPNLSGGTGQIAIVLGAGETTFDSCCNTQSIQDGTNQWVDRWGGLDNNSGDCTNGVYFESDRAANGDNNVRLCCASAGSRTKTTMGVAASSSTWERWTWVANASGTSVQGYKNGVAQGSPVVTNIPTSTQSFSACSFQLIKTLGSSARNVDRDYGETTIVFTASR